MDSLVIYDSQFGNTSIVAEIVGNALVLVTDKYPPFSLH